MFTWKLEWKKADQCCYFAARLMSLTKYFISIILISNNIITLTEMLKQCPREKIFLKNNSFPYGKLGG
jgi:hypothetical protein